MHRSGPTIRTSWPSLRLTTCAIGVGLCVMTGAARAQDTQGAQSADELQQRFMSAFSIDKIGELTGMKKDEKEKAGIEYRERSPLVVPRTRDLPPPETGEAAAKVTNWPKDPAAAGARKPAATRAALATQQPGTTELPEGRSGGFKIDFSDFNLGKKKAEAVQFTSEPPRETLTQPPIGYQTPSPDYAYGTGGEPAAQTFHNPTLPTNESK
ncbi:MAG: hypothetical protein P4M07_12180 [Xanthobacteraceae bacterium]|nr:hypothetical protein [Xanthobacteraceae bacterium]